MNDTICAISTSLGVGAISIIKVSGNEAISIVDKIVAVYDFGLSTSFALKKNYASMFMFMIFCCYFNNL